MAMSNRLNHINMDDTHKLLELATVLDLDVRLSTLVRDLEWPVLHVALDLGIIELATNETLSVEDGVLRVRVVGILGGVTNTENSWSERSDGMRYDATHRRSSPKATHEGVIR